MKYARVYLSTFVDIEVNDEEFNNEEEMKTYAKENLSDNICKQDIYDNLSYEPESIDIIEI